MADHKTLELCKELNELDTQITGLTLKRKEVLEKLNEICTLTTMHKIGQEFGEKIKKGKEMDTVDACLYANTVMLSWRNRLSRASPWYFRNTLEKFPEFLPSSFTREMADELLANLEEALAKDLTALASDA